jgi:hypothetical protein
MMQGIRKKFAHIYNISTSTMMDEFFTSDVASDIVFSEDDQVLPELDTDDAPRSSAAGSTQQSEGNKDGSTNEMVTDSESESAQPEKKRRKARSWVWNYGTMVKVKSTKYFCCDTP